MVPLRWVVEGLEEMACAASPAARAGTRMNVIRLRFGEADLEMLRVGRASYPLGGCGSLPYVLRSWMRPSDLRCLIHSLPVFRARS